MKKFTNSKTMWVALAISVLGALEVFDFTSVLSESTSGMITLGIGLIMGILRKVTTKAIQ